MPRGRPKKIKVKIKSEVPQIKSYLKTMGKVCNAEGQTIQEAITNLKPQVARGMGILTLEKGKVKKERILLPNMVMRLFRKDIGRLNKEVALKQVIGLFDASLF